MFVYWVDQYAHTVTPLSLAGTNSIGFTVDNNAGSYTASRFMIVFNISGGSLPVTITNMPSANYSLQLINTPGQVCIVI